MRTDNGLDHGGTFTTGAYDGIASKHLPPASKTSWWIGVPREQFKAAQAAAERVEANKPANTSTAHVHRAAGAPRACRTCGRMLTATDQVKGLARCTWCRKPDAGTKRTREAA